MSNIFRSQCHLLFNLKQIKSSNYFLTNRDVFTHKTTSEKVTILDEALYPRKQIQSTRFKETKVSHLDGHNICPLPPIDVRYKKIICLKQNERQIGNPITKELGAISRHTKPKRDQVETCCYIFHLEKNHDNFGI